MPERAGFQIEKIDLITKEGERISIALKKIDRVFRIMEYNSIRQIINLPWKGMSKTKLSKILFTGIMRKLKNIEPRVSRGMCLPLLSPIVASMNKLKKVVRIEVFLKDKTFYFILKSHYLMWDTILGIKQIMYTNQYNVSEKNMKNKIIIDAGSYMGDFSLLAVYMGAKRVYAFEPVPNTANVLEENIKLNKMQDRIVVVRKALGDENSSGNISFSGGVDGGAKIGEVAGQKSEKIEIVKLDDFVAKNKIKRVDFIKMDVEGFEDKLLIGASKTIKKFKPVLSLSAYHKRDDKERLPKVIRAIRKDYKIILNNFCEEDFYCW
ncbi:MAG: FkbM family methyltransferase [Candidatus Pacearchaeota archaeon]|nr:FkbM family methyltransferase [Candidatus Pacearchaeota archaeon]